MNWLTITPTGKKKVCVSTNTVCEDKTIISNPLGKRKAAVLYYDRDLIINIRNNSQGGIDVVVYGQKLIYEKELSKPTSPHHTFFMREEER